ncbi:MAG: (2Fe-2S) ferredoxin domain-containing protein [Bacteroidota bacterium]|jgi:(2Fe-2S) ferredoxin|nr:(2Fe-2S) ferredoxin domain-containing protein [Sphingobacteriales bacterium]
MRFEKHIFICANQKAEGKACCGEQRGIELVEKFREVLTERGLKGKVRAQRAGCLDACKFGPALVVYPEGTYYGHVKPEDVATIIDEHIVNGRVVDSLELKF